MAVAFRAMTTAGDATAANLTLTKPTGTVDNDILIAWITKETTTTPGIPTGWTLIPNQAGVANSRSCHKYWKRASSEGASWTWTFASTWRTGYVSAYSGGETSGDPLDPASPTAMSESASASTLATPSQTTTVANVMLIASGYHILGFSAGWVAPAGMTDRVEFQNCSGYDVLQAGIGASGTKTIDSGASASTMKAALIGIKEPQAAGDPEGSLLGGKLLRGGLLQHGVLVGSG